MTPPFLPSSLKSAAAALLPGIGLLSPFLAPALPAADLLKLADFETGDLSQIGSQKALPDSITLVTAPAPVRAGKYAARLLLRASDPEVSRGQRSEFSDGKTQILMNQDYWYGLSLHVPEDFVTPKEKNAVLFQWHTQQGGPSPVLSIRVQKDEWLIQAEPDPNSKRRTLKRLPLEKGRWVDWVVHARWAADKTGFWTIWKDGVEIVSEKDVITQYPEKLGPYAKFGQYHSVYDAAQNVIYADEYRVAGPGGSYQDVMPKRPMK